MHSLDSEEGLLMETTLENLDPVLELPALADDFELTPEQIDAYRREGHLGLRGVASLAEIAAYRSLILDTVGRYAPVSDPLEEREPGMFIQVVNLWERDPGVRRFVFAQRFAKLAADLMGVDAVRVLYDQALIKEPGGIITAWHQDGGGLPPNDKTDKTITMWMPLVPISQSLDFVSASHRDGALVPGIDISDASEDYFNEQIATNGWSVRHYGQMAAGDATFHHGWSLHRAPAHPASEPPREVLAIIYIADGATVVEPEDAGITENLELVRNELARFGWKAGDPVAGPLAPLVYERAS